MSTLSQTALYRIASEIPGEPGMIPFSVALNGVHVDANQASLTFSLSTQAPGYRYARCDYMDVLSYGPALGAHTTLFRLILPQVYGFALGSVTLDVGASGIRQASQLLGEHTWFPIDSTLTATSRVFTAGIGAAQVDLTITLWGALWMGTQAEPTKPVTLAGVKRPFNWRA